jgi:4'-phosphopantetheinyl transferase
MNKNQIDVWAIDIPKLFEQEDYYYSLLNQPEKNRANAFVTAELKCRYTVSQGVLRSLLAEYLSLNPEQIVYNFGPHKKPYLADNQIDLYFNLSHSHDMALVALSFSDEVGVDIEKLNPKKLDSGLEKSVLSDNELELFTSMPLEKRTVAFFSAWTHKESLLKLTGIGLYKELKELEVPLHPVVKTSPIMFENSQMYLRSFYVTEDYLGAVSSTKQNFDINIRNFK